MILFSMKKNPFYILEICLILTDCLLIRWLVVSYSMMRKLSCTCYVSNRNQTVAIENVLHNSIPNIAKCSFAYRHKRHLWYSHKTQQSVRTWAQSVVVVFHTLSIANAARKKKILSGLSLIFDKFMQNSMQWNEHLFILIHQIIYCFVIYLFFPVCLSS